MKKYVLQRRAHPWSNHWETLEHRQYDSLEEARLLIADRVYQYHHWMITAEGGHEIVTLYLEEVPA